MSTADKTQPMAKIGLWARKNWRALVFLAVLLGALGLYLAYMVKTQWNYTLDTTFPLGIWKAYSLVLGGAALVLVAMVSVGVKLWHATVPQLFLLLCIGLGTLYSLLLPPISTPDEMGHIATAYRYSNVLMGQPFAIEGETYTLRVEDREALNYPQRFDFEDNLKALQELTQTEQLRGQTTATVPDAGNVFLYLPQILATTLGRLLHLGGVQLIYLGRMFNLVFFSLAVFYTLRKMHTGQVLFALAALLPTSLQQAASFSYDATILASGLFLTGTFVRLMTDKSVLGRLDMVLLCISGSLLSAAKYGVYIPLLLLLLFLPKACFSRGWTKRKFAIVFGIVVALFFLAINIPNFLYVFNAAGETQRSGGDTNTILRLLQEPGHSVSLIMNTLAISSSNLWLESFGAVLGYFYKQIPTLYMFAFYTLLFLGAIPARPQAGLLQKPVRYSIQATCCVMFLILCLASYSWTPTGSNIIQGLQGRYFLPFLPLLFLSLQNGSLRLRPKASISLLPAMAVVQFFTIAHLLFSLLRVAEAS